ncbi:hypothetical protein IAD21_00546 [Abditibacteriota bacterium]|nr:hypothetical protein IAD21_00546 [Abditibacteriota bacterium]
MKRVLQVLLLVVGCALMGGCSDNSDKWQVGTKLYYHDDFFGTVITREGDDITVQDPKTEFNPGLTTHCSAENLASRGVYAK